MDERIGSTNYCEVKNGKLEKLCVAFPDPQTAGTTKSY